ncbi:hypothetical protein QOZ80_3AG0220470 [Eleusine coracana subsp. coracana]|nr:hypothetical protein QOZ80_3AG0220470 [Eleusine coracana subsp. coracana]
MAMGNLAGVVVYLVLSLSAWVAAGGVATNASDALSMHALATATGADRVFNWAAGSDPCRDHWYGVSCDDLGRVVKIHVEGVILHGTLPRELPLSALKQLGFVRTRLAGSLPVLPLLPLLKTLKLDGNLFTVMPPGFFNGFSSLRYFSASENPVLRDWELPSELRRLTDLTSFNADNAGVNGTVASFLGVGGDGNDDDAFRSLIRPPGHGGASHRWQSVHRSVAGLGQPPEAQGTLRRSQSPIRTGARGADPARPSDLGVARGEPAPRSGPRVREHGTERRGHPRLLLPPASGPLQSALLSVAAGFNYPEVLAVSWRRNDPCLEWVGVHCDAGNIVTGLNLCRLGLNGTLDPVIGALKSLTTILLSGNNISGAIPPSVADLPALRLLEISDNAFQGPVPEFRSGVEVWADGNSNIIATTTSVPSCSIKPFRAAVVILAALVGGVL